VKRSGSTDLVVAAPLRIEARALRRGAPQLRVVRTGMGPRRSRAAARRLASDSAGAIAVAGVCGAVVSGLEPGDIVVASELRAPDCDRLVLDPEPLCRSLGELGLRAHPGALQGADRVVRGAERARLAEQGVVAVDMESPWLAPGARGRPLAVLRIVLDAPEHELLGLGFPRQMRRALRSLGAAAPALERWAALAIESFVPGLPSPPPDAVSARAL